MKKLIYYILYKLHANKKLDESNNSNTEIINTIETKIREIKGNEKDRLLSFVSLIKKQFEDTKKRKNNSTEQENKPQTQINHVIKEMKETEQTYIGQLGELKNKINELENNDRKKMETTITQLIKISETMKKNFPKPQEKNINALEKEVNKLPDSYFELLKKEKNNKNTSGDIIEGNPLVILQRLMRYPMLYKDLIEKTLKEKDEEKYNKLKHTTNKDPYSELENNEHVGQYVKILKKFKEIATYMNERKRSIDNFSAQRNSGIGSSNESNSKYYSSSEA